MTGGVQHVLYHLGYYWANVLPRRMAHGLAIRLADWEYAHRVADREAVQDNLRAVLGAADPAVARYAQAVFRNFGKYLIDFFRMDRLNTSSLERLVEIRGFEHLRQALDLRRGVIGLTGHLGHWELAGVALALRLVPITAVALDHRHPGVNAFFVARRQRHGVESVPLGHAFKVCLQRLRQCAMVGLLADRNFGDHGVRVSFLGRTALLPRGPAVLSTLTGAPIVPCFAIRQPDERFVFYLESPIMPDGQRPRDQEVHRLTVCYAQVLETYIRRYPDQWCMFHRFWLER